MLGSQNSLSIEIKDQDSRGGWITGELVIIDNLKNSNALEIYWANNPYNPLGQYRPLIKIPKNKGFVICALPGDCSIDAKKLNEFRHYNNKFKR